MVAEDAASIPRRTYAYGGAGNAISKKLRRFSSVSEV